MTKTAATPATGTFAGGFTATVGPTGGVVLAGELDISGLNALRAALDQALLEPGAWLRIDAADLSFIDSAALSVLLRYQVAAAARHRWIRLEHVSHTVGAVLDLLDLRPVLMPPDRPRGRPSVISAASSS
jgi:anti-anti-sigma factor